MWFLLFQHLLYYKSAVASWKTILRNNNYSIFTNVHRGILFYNNPSQTLNNKPSSAEYVKVRGYSAKTVCD